MKKRHDHLALLALAVLTVAAIFCDGQTNPPTVTPALPRNTPTYTPASLSTNAPISAKTGVPSPPTSEPTPIDTLQPSGCNNNSEFVADVTVPDDSYMAPGEGFSKVWRVRNNGSCPWTAGYQFVYMKDQLMGAPESVLLTQEVPPGATYDVSVAFTAPSAPGTYRSTWQLRAPDGAAFGARLFVQIVVPAPAEETAPVTTAVVVEIVQSVSEKLTYESAYDAPLWFVSGLTPGLVPRNPGCPVSPSETPAITATGWLANRSTLCLYGFPLDKEMVVDLYTPSGELAGSGVFRVVRDDAGHLTTHQTQPTPVVSVLVGQAGDVDGVTVVSINFWLPAGMPPGEWSAVASSNGIRAVGSFAVKYSEPAISTMPDVPINLFEDYSFASYSVGDRVIVRGTRFDPGKWLPLGIYFHSSSGFVVQGSQGIHVDEQGNFSTAVQVESSEPGTYYIIAILDSDVQGDYNLLYYHPRVASYKVAGAPPGCPPPLRGRGDIYEWQQDDWLSKLADKYYGDVLAYPAIVYYTNLMHAKDPSFSQIIFEDWLHVGDRLYLPSLEEVQAYMHCP